MRKKQSEWRQRDRPKELNIERGRKADRQTGIQNWSFITHTHTQTNKHTHTRIHTQTHTRRDKEEETDDENLVEGKKDE